MISTSSQTLEEGIVRIHAFPKGRTKELKELVLLFQKFFPHVAVSLSGHTNIETFLRDAVQDPHGVLLYDFQEKGLAVGSTNIQSTFLYSLKTSSVTAWFIRLSLFLINPLLAGLRATWLIRTPKTQCGFIRYLQVQENLEIERATIMRKFAMISSMEREFKLANCRQVWVELPRLQEDDLEVYLLRGYSLVDRGFKNYLLRKIFYA